MKLTANIVLVLAIMVSTSALLASVYPGALQDILFWVILTSILWLPLFTIGGIMLLAALIRRRTKPRELPLVRLGLACAILISSYVAIRYYVPRRIAFTASRADFKAMIAHAPVQESAAPLNQRLGLYVVTDYATDPRGGTYFRVYQTSGFMRDTRSYGFVLKPNRGGTPYGGESYKLHPLGNGWYWFRAAEESF